MRARATEGTTGDRQDHSTSPGGREEDTVYQGGRIVGRVVDPEVDTEANQIRFAEISNSDYLLLPEECEFDQYTIVVRKIGYASRVEKSTPFKGRILRGVTAEIVGYREQ